MFTMQASWDLPHLLGYLSSWSATARYIARNHVDPVIALSKKLEKIWGEPHQLQTISWPLTVRVGRKQKARE